jgi:hypothetical protein
MIVIRTDSKDFGQGRDRLQERGREDGGRG